jgi:hypothetical protein
MTLGRRPLGLISLDTLPLGGSALPTALSRDVPTRL